MSQSENYWERTDFPFMDYPEGITQKETMGCVVSSIAGAINHLTKETIWDEESLIDACGRRVTDNWQGPNVITVAMRNIQACAKLDGRFCPGTPRSDFQKTVRQLIDEGATVILSRKARSGFTSSHHMLTLLKRDGDRYQVWDTGGVRGYILECELHKTIPKYNGGVLEVHPNNDFFVISRKEKKEAISDELEQSAPSSLELRGMLEEMVVKDPPEGPMLPSTSRDQQMSKTASHTKDEILKEIRNIILYRRNLLRPTDRLDYEEFQKRICAFAGAVYHFKERLASWVKKSGIKIEPSVKDIAEGSMPLLVCGDLFNYKKHGGCENRSKLSPELSGMKLQRAGQVIELRYDGKMKTGELGRAVPYAIEIHCSENRTLGDAVKYIAKAFSVWVPTIEQIGLLDRQDAVDAVLLDELAVFTKDEP